jgi:hypothetical protein
LRIPFPERIPINRVAIFAGALFFIQLLEKTPIYFCAGSLVFILIAAFAFNAAGGLTRASGAYIFSYSMLVVIIGICYKAFLGEAAQTLLQDPVTDIEAYVATIAGMFAAVMVSRRLRRRSGLLQGVLIESRMYEASIGCIAVGMVGALGISLLGQSAALLQSAFAQLNQLVPLGIIIGVMYEIRRSGGSRSSNIAIMIGGAYVFFYGIIGFSKQGLLTPFYCWLLPVAALRYRLSRAQVVSILAGLFIVFHYLVPFAQYGRGQVSELATASERLSTAIRLLEHPTQTRRLFLDESAEEGPGLGSYYSTNEGFWERLQFISADDKLNAVTDQGKVFGLWPLKAALLNTIPRFLWHDKPGINPGNMYAHDISDTAQGEGDVTTGISFSPTGEAYHLATWTGVLVIGPLMWCIFFVAYDSLLGDLRATPWGLLALALISHIAPEGGLSGVIGLMAFGIEIFTFCAFFAAWFAPLIASALLGPRRTKSTRNLPISAPVKPITPR